MGQDDGGCCGCAEQQEKAATGQAERQHNPIVREITRLGHNALLSRLHMKRENFRERADH
jgi:hypothetical protein